MTNFKVICTTENTYNILQNNLPHLINPIESKLGTSTTNDINLIIYLMEGKYSPLVIKTKDGDMKELPSFLSPQFGAVLLYDTRLLSQLTVTLVIVTIVNSQLLISTWSDRIKFILILYEW